MRSIIQTGPSMIVKVKAEDGEEKTIGFVDAISFNQTTGSKPIFVVDNPFPAEIANAAGQSMVNGNISMYLPKGTSLESLGMVPYKRQGEKTWLGATKYLSIRIYDRSSESIVYSLDFVKFNGYTVNIAARSVVKLTAQFSGMYATTGAELT